MAHGHDEVQLACFRVLVKIGIFLIDWLGQQVDPLRFFNDEEGVFDLGFDGEDVPHTEGGLFLKPRSGLSGLSEFYTNSPGKNDEALLRFLVEVSPAGCSLIGCDQIDFTPDPGIEKARDPASGIGVLEIVRNDLE